jgi:DNA-binding CsgD family transcriptional regulator
LSIAPQPHRVDGGGDVSVAEARVLADCAFSAGSGDRVQAGSYILERLRDIVHADAAAIFAWNPAARRHVLVSNLDYTQPTLDGLSDPYADTEPHQRMLSSHEPLRIADLPYDYRDTEMYQNVIAPMGFRDGMSTCLFAADGHYVGMVHMSSATRGSFEPRHPTLLSAIAPSVGKLCTLARPSAFPASDASRSAFVDATGCIQLVNHTATLKIGTDPRFTATIAAFLDGGKELVVGLWPCAKTWLRVRLDRVNEPLMDSRAVALVTETDVLLPYGLTDREVDVLTGIAEGMSNQQIASSHAISIRTTTTHVERILHKLDERSRTGAAIRAIHEGLIRLVSPA